MSWFVTLLPVFHQVSHMKYSHFLQYRIAICLFCKKLENAKNLHIEIMKIIKHVNERDQKFNVSNRKGVVYAHQKIPVSISTIWYKLLYVTLTYQQAVQLEFCQQFHFKSPWMGLSSNARLLLRRDGCIYQTTTISIKRHKKY